MSRTETTSRAPRTWLLSVVAGLSILSVAGFVVSTRAAAARDEAELSLCLGGPTAPAKGTRAERIERAAFVGSVPHSPPEPVTQTPEDRARRRPREPKRPDPTTWPFRCSGPAKRFGHGIGGRLWKGEASARARELAAALDEGYLPGDSSWLARAAPSGALASTEVGELDPVLDDDAAAASRQLLDAYFRPWGPRDRQPFDVLEVDASTTSTCLVEAEGDRPLAALRCGPKKRAERFAGADVVEVGGGRLLRMTPAPPFTVDTVDGSKVTGSLVVPGEDRGAILLPEGLFSIDATGIWTRPLDGGALGEARRLGDGSRRGQVRACRRRTGWGLLFERFADSGGDAPARRGASYVPVFVDAGGATAGTPVGPGATTTSDGDPWWGSATLACDADEIRITWVASGVRDWVDEHRLHRARCSRTRCDLASTEVRELGVVLGLQPGDFSGDATPVSAESPTVFDLGDTIWLVWDANRRLAARAAPFDALEHAPTITLAATYRGGFVAPPFASGVEIDGFSGLSRDDVALVALHETRERTHATFVLRLGADGHAEALVPRMR